MGICLWCSRALALAALAGALAAAAPPAAAGPQGLAGRAFPATGAIDDFGNRKGRLPPNWYGSEGLRGYHIHQGQVRVTRGGPIYWRLQSFGADQEAYMTLVALDPNATSHGLLLKVQRHNWRRGAILVTYDAAAQQVAILSFTPERREPAVLARFAQTLAAGDVLGARALADGEVRAYVNGVLVGTADAGPVFAHVGGRLGVWFAGASRAAFDDFGGGTVEADSGGENSG
ncbi:MAG TPA: hypothetical protein VNL77_10735 [Roseiflexaceae bacterium]|nr:hypothetical protein [Roseiflexaceae bacterium]